MKKRAIIVHCWEGNPDYCWYPWLKKELGIKGFDVFVPAMPDTDHPDKDRWVNHLSEVVGSVSDHDYFIGHSVGCIAVLRFLEQLPANQTAAGVVLVAGYGKDLVYDGYAGELASFYKEPIDWGTIKTKAQFFTAIHSTNDPWVTRESNKFMADKLGAKWLVLGNRGHFSANDHCQRLPEVLAAVMAL